MQPGTILADRYRLEDVLATGGMGVVYMATDLASKRAVAIKVLKKDILNEPRFIERLRREAKAASSLTHPHIVEVLDLVIEESKSSIKGEIDRAFLVMEHLEGEVWGLAITDTPAGMVASTVVTIGRQLLSALDAAHRAGLIHRDVKPDNVFLVKREATGAGGGALRAKLLDFGLVKLETADKLTATHGVLGTWQYMAPEQARGERADARVDVYSLGACLYYALTKKRPYQAADVEAATYALSTQAAPPLRSMRPDLDQALAQVIEKAIEKNVADRWQSAREMRDALALFDLSTVGTPRSIDATGEDDDVITRPVIATPSRPPPPPPTPTPTPNAAAAARAASAPEEIDSDDLEPIRTGDIEPDILPPRRKKEVPSPPAKLPTIEPEPESDRAPTTTATAPPLALAQTQRVDDAHTGSTPTPKKMSKMSAHQPSRHRWRPPQKVRDTAAIAVVSPPIVVGIDDDDVVGLRPRRTLLIVAGVFLFLMGIMLGRIMLNP